MELSNEWTKKMNNNFGSCDFSLLRSIVIGLIRVVGTLHQVSKIIHIIPAMYVYQYN